jgi:hypothetical protein
METRCAFSQLRAACLAPWLPSVVSPPPFLALAFLIRVAHKIVTRHHDRDGCWLLVPFLIPVLGGSLALLRRAKRGRRRHSGQAREVQVPQHVVVDAEVVVQVAIGSAERWLFSRLDTERLLREDPLVGVLLRSSSEWPVERTVSSKGWTMWSDDGHLTMLMARNIGCRSITNFVESAISHTGVCVGRTNGCTYPRGHTMGPGLAQQRLGERRDCSNTRPRQCLR